MNYVGIDCDSKQISAVVLNNKGKYLISYTREYKLTDSKDRFIYLVEWFEHISYMLFEHSEEGEHVGLVVIEDSIYIQNPKASMDIAKVTGYLMSVALRHGKDIKVVDNRVWKKKIVGKGNATKPEIMEFVNNNFNIKITNEHVADAACIALWGVKYGKETVGC